jgi:hypothetical protein
MVQSAHGLTLETAFTRLSVQGYVYIIRECDFVRLNEDIYKIGRTAKTNPEDRFQKYRKGTEIIGFFKVNDSIECENKRSEL